MRHIVPPLAVVLLESLAIAVLADVEIWKAWTLAIPKSEALEKGYTMLVVPVSFLLVFRLNRAAVRFYDARAAMGKLIEICRVLASEAACYCAHDRRARDDLCRWVAVFPAATRNYIRAEAPDQTRELAGVLSPVEAAALRRATMQPLLCLDRMRKAALDAARSSREDPGAVGGPALRSIEENICTLTGAMGAMERINSTPLPFAYVSHLRTFLLLYLLGMPVALHSSWGWAVPVVTFLVGFAMLGIEGAAVACERPFGLNRNHLPMDYFCQVVAKNVAQILRQAEELEETSKE